MKEELFPLWKYKTRLPLGLTRNEWLTYCNPWSAKKQLHSPEKFSWELHNSVGAGVECLDLLGLLDPVLGRTAKALFPIVSPLVFPLEVEKLVTMKGYILFCKFFNFKEPQSRGGHWGKWEGEGGHGRAVDCFRQDRQSQVPADVSALCYHCFILTLPGYPESQWQHMWVIASQLFYDCCVCPLALEAVVHCYTILCWKRIINHFSFILKDWPDEVSMKVQERVKLDLQDY